MHDNIKFFDDINIDEMLYYTVFPKRTIKNLIKTVYNILIKTLFWSNSFECKGTPRALFLFSNSYVDRKDLLETFDKIVGLVNNYLKMVGGRTAKWHLSFISELVVIFKWNYFLKSKETDFFMRMYKIDLLYRVYIDYLEYQVYAKKHSIQIDKLFTFCDALSVDYYFTCMFNSENKTTITMQHGLYDATTYSLSRSKIFLANSQYSVDEAASFGYKREGLVAVGLPSCVSVPPVENKKMYNTERIGVILDGGGRHKDNEDLILFMQNFCKKYKRKMYIKYHPTLNVNNYSEIIDRDVVEAIVGTEKNILQFAEEIDIGILRNSTCLLELINCEVPSYIFHSNVQDYDDYQNVKMLRFETEEELQALLNKIGEPEFNKDFAKWKKYYGDRNGATENYRKILNQLGIE